MIVKGSIIYFNSLYISPNYTFIDKDHFILVERNIFYTENYEIIKHDNDYYPYITPFHRTNDIPDNGKIVIEIYNFVKRNDIKLFLKATTTIRLKMLDNALSKCSIIGSASQLMKMKLKAG